MIISSVIIFQVSNQLSTKLLKLFTKLINCYSYEHSNFIKCLLTYMDKLYYKDIR